MTFKYNTRQFIKEMQCRPCLWNVNLAEYNDRITRENAWIEIAHIMYDEWDDLNSDDKAEKVKDLQKKWKGLRDYHTRVQNKKYIPKSSGLPGGRKRPFLDMLYFLNDKKKGVFASQKPAETDFGIAQSNSIATHKKAKPGPTKTRAAVTEPYSPETTERPPTDPDANFLFSILPDMKSMNPSQNFEFRFHVMKLIKDIKYNEPNSDFYVYADPGTSAFATQVPKYKTTIIAEPEMENLDHISNESAVSSPEDRKVILHHSE